ncbi:MAG: T9SS type A sorting domain-containing protein [Ignavibacteriaceae bacterium]|nr:T9SS type A sorting domain-containing protein [Ignavibacteriaceae bacterium]
MKALFILIAVIFFLSTPYAESRDSIFVVISEDTVHIWNTGAWENCLCLFRMDVSISNDTIYVTEVDTANNWAFCFCYFDLCTTVTGLQSGNYFVEVYRKKMYYPDTLFYIGSTSFTFEGSSLAFISQSYQSDCYNITQVQEGEVQPKEFNLEQNYPNPFNPSTVISYHLPISGLVSLKVYDILGNEVATLVNEYKSAGKYEVIFNVETHRDASLPSGIYFYQLKAGSFIQTKKMILLR